MANEQSKSWYPSTIGLEDIDQSVKDWFDESSRFVINRGKGSEDVRVVWIETDQYGEWLKNWDDQDTRGETELPVLFIGRPPASVSHWEYANIHNKRYTYRTQIERKTGGGIEFTKHTIKEPIHAKLVYELRFQSHKIWEQNQFVEQILRYFAAKFVYLSISGQWCSMMMDGEMTDDSNFGAPDEEKLYQTVLPVAVNAHLISDDDSKEERMAWRFSLGERIT